MRLERTTSGFVDLRSDSIELRSRKIGGRYRTRTRMRKLATAFKAAAIPIWLTFRSENVRSEAGRNHVFLRRQEKNLAGALRFERRISILETGRFAVKLCAYRILSVARCQSSIEYKLKCPDDDGLLAID